MVEVATKERPCVSGVTRSNGGALLAQCVEDFLVAEPLAVRMAELVPERVVVRVGMTFCDDELNGTAQREWTGERE